MRAILSVYDKTGIAELAKGLHELGIDEPPRRTAAGPRVCRR